MATDWPAHTHMTRDIKRPGVCPGCDPYHVARENEHAALTSALLPHLVAAVAICLEDCGSPRCQGEYDDIHHVHAHHPLLYQDMLRRGIPRCFNKECEPGNLPADSDERSER